MRAFIPTRSLKNLILVKRIEWERRIAKEYQYHNLKVCKSISSDKQNSKGVISNG